jgi:hypothetical protein
MRDSKRRLIHKVFQIAKATNRFVHMSESNFKEFHKSCQMDDFNGAEYCKKLVIHDYDDACNAHALHLEYAACYGGYRLDYYCNGGGGMSHFMSSSRTSAESLSDILEAFILGYQRATDDHEENDTLKAV